MNSSHLFYGQLFESRQRAGEEAHDEGGGGADDIQHGGREHGDVGVLPGEGVEESHDGMATLRQRAAGGEKGNMFIIKYFIYRKHTINLLTTAFYTLNWIYTFSRYYINRL